MIDISAIILVKDEKLHIRRCLERILPFVNKVFVIDCYSTDGTVEICREYQKVHLIQHAWPGNQALQFNWALDHLDIKSEWIIRLDADEYLAYDEGTRLINTLKLMKHGENAVSLLRERYFMGRHIKYGGTDLVPLVRVFRKGTARSELRAMDEHIVMIDGHVKETDIRFVDHNLNTLEFWVKKHLNYAKREASMFSQKTDHSPFSDNGEGSQAMKSKRKQKKWYNHLPLFWRAIAYFSYRYFLRFGFLDGREGFLWHFFQGLWYRILVDTYIFTDRKHIKHE